ncbi:MAG: ABC transporter ATP-binding protein [Oscillospiraceae bacterium]|nr:ABC transporter ATP-binding protein [Oscillospiraceae bacterium]
MNKIELTGTYKSFGTVQAVKDVSMTLEPGKIYGLLGRNGAGKSTLLNMITGRVFPDAGTITVDGEGVIENDRALGKIYLMGESKYYPDGMRLKEAYHWAAKFYPDFDLENAYYLAKQFGLNTRKKFKELSTGMSTMFRLSVALSTGAPYIFLDEPVLGLDAVHRDMFYRLLVEQFERHPACYVISTHLIEEVTGLLEEVYIIRGGELLLHESTEGLLARGYTATGPVSVIDDFIVGRTCIGSDSLGGLKSAYLLEPVETAQIPEGVEVSKLNLQQLFVQLTKEQGGIV